MLISFVSAESSMKYIIKHLTVLELSCNSALGLHESLLFRVSKLYIKKQEINDAGRELFIFLSFNLKLAIILSQGIHVRKYFYAFLLKVQQHSHLMTKLIRRCSGTTQGLRLPKIVLALRRQYPSQDTPAAEAALASVSLCTHWFVSPHQF